MYDKDLPVFDTEHPILKVGSTLLFTVGDAQQQCFITNIDLEQKHTVVTIAEKIDGEAICYLHNTINYKGAA